MENNCKRQFSNGRDCKRIIYNEASMNLVLIKLEAETNTIDKLFQTNYSRDLQGADNIEELLKIQVDF